MRKLKKFESRNNCFWERFKLGYIQNSKKSQTYGQKKCKLKLKQQIKKNIYAESQSSKDINYHLNISNVSLDANFLSTHIFLVYFYNNKITQ